MWFPQGFIIGKPGRHIAKADALGHIFGYTCFNDGSIRDIQFKHSIAAGKNFHATGGFGPWIPRATAAAPLGSPRPTPEHAVLLTFRRPTAFPPPSPPPISVGFVRCFNGVELGEVGLIPSTASLRAAPPAIGSFPMQS